MRRSFLLSVLVVSPALIAQSETNTPVVLDADSPQLHLVNKTPPMYPPIARAAHVGGAVSLQIEIGPDGHVTSAKVLKGPDMLQGAAKDALRHWLYSPVMVDGKAVPVITTVSVPFDFNVPSSQYAQPTPSDVQDRKLEEHLQSLEEACTSSLAAKSQDPAKQIERCQKAADLADQFSGNGFDERRRTYTYLSTAFRHNKQLPDALTAANKAVLAAQQGFEDGPRGSAAYSVRAEAEAQLGKLPQASDDLTVAEDDERGVIARCLTPSKMKDIDRLNQALAKSNYIPVLKGLLIYHAQVLSAMGKPAEAAAKKAEADKL